MTVAASDRQEWILPSHAARLLGIAPGSLKKVAPGLGIRRLEIPGLVGGKYNRADVEEAKARLERSAAEVVAAAQQTPEPSRRIGRPRDNETARPRR